MREKEREREGDERERERGVGHERERERGKRVREGGRIERRRNIAFWAENLSENHPFSLSLFPLSPPPHNSLSLSTRNEIQFHTSAYLYVLRPCPALSFSTQAFWRLFCDITLLASFFLSTFLLPICN